MCRHPYRLLCRARPTIGVVPKSPGPTIQCHNFPISSFSSHTVRRSSSVQSPNRASQNGNARTPWLVSGAVVVGALTASYLYRRYKKSTPTGAENDLSSEDSQMISYQEVQKHTSVDDCWVIIKGNVYDLTEFLKMHPGGQQAILAVAGTDASELFSMIHPPNALAILPAEKCLGPVHPATVPEPEEKELTEEDKKREIARAELPGAAAMLLVQDFEDWAERVLTSTAWAYYRSAADEEITFHENRDAFKRYFLRPRVLVRDMTHGNTETKFMGIETTLPVFISPAAMAKLGHPLGEINLTRAAGEYGIVQAISSNASCGLEEMFDSAGDDQALFFQLYLNKDRSISEQLIQKVEELGAKAIIFTVDVPWESKRTLDARTKVSSLPTLGIANASSTASAPTSVSNAIGGYQDRNLTWNDVSFIRKFTKLPIIIKGVQSLEDVQRCVDHGVEGVIISNHGGRQADYAPAPIDVLYEIRTLRPDLFDKIEIMIDGGIRSGADVAKAIALGAKAVGLGRPFLYANGTHGEDGVRRVLEILHEELTSTMRNIGASTIEELKPEMVGPAGPWVGSNRPSYIPVPKA